MSANPPKVERPCRCDRFTGPTYRAGECRPCWLAAHDGEYQELWGLEVTAPRGARHGRFAPAPALPSVQVGYCAARKMWDWKVTKDGKVVDSGSEPTEAAARKEARDALGYEPPKVLATLNESNVAVGLDGRRFNGSILPYRDGYLFAFRTGWAGSQIGLAMLGRDLKPTGWHRMLTLDHPACGWGREDPRLFWFRGAAHLSFTGVTGRAGPTDVLYARLNDELTVEAIHCPAYADRQLWEKNWVPFEYAGRLYAVYSVSPHRILRIDGDAAELAYETPTPHRWSGGHLRGGAAPVFHAGEWWHWFHGRTGPDDKPTYNVGVYTFDPRPPFRVRRMTPNPLAVGDWSDAHGYYAAVVFPAGAVSLGDRWLVSAGVHDRQTDVIRFDAAAVEAELVPV